MSAKKEGFWDRIWEVLQKTLFYETPTLQLRREIYGTASGNKLGLPRSQVI